MKYLYSLWFSIVFYGANIVMPLSMIWSLLLPRRAVFWAVMVWLTVVAWVEKYLCGISFRVIGREHIPPGACIVAAKHQSEWETFKLHILLGDVAIVLKKELLRIPVIGWYMARSGSIGIDRGGRTAAIAGMVKAAKAAAAEGRRIVIFPEGTRASPGEQRPYKSGVAALYQELNLPVVPMALNSGVLWPRNSFFKKPGVVTVEFLPPIPPGLSREDMMQRLRDELEPAALRLLE